MAKKTSEFTTLTETMHLTCDSAMKSEIVKASNGMLFKLFADVHNGSNCWNIYVWSNTLSQWNMLASKDIIPEVKYLDYFRCAVGDKPNPLIASNWTAMKNFIKTFASNV